MPLIAVWVDEEDIVRQVVIVVNYVAMRMSAQLYQLKSKTTYVR
jgi:hypothetical protein